MTEELYYTSAYISDFVAKVVDCRKCENDRRITDGSECQDNGGSQEKYEIILDKTAFFPEQGGQGSDGGVLEFDDGAQRTQVLHVSISDEIRHLVDREIPVGTTVHGVIDFSHRFSNMQQHTGEHIFSGLVCSRFGYDNVGFHLSDSEVTMDYNGPITLEEIREIEAKANEVIWQNLEVLCEFPEESRLENIPYRSKKELTGDVRIVTIPGVDICACCAPHVLRTGEIGLLKVVGLQNYKGGVRVNILCGKRAMDYLNKEHEIVSELSGMFTTASENVITAVKKLSNANSELKQELSEATSALIEAEVKEIDKSLENVVLIKKNLDSNAMRKLVNLLTADHSGFCGVFAGSKAEGYRFIVGTSNKDKDCMEIANMMRTQFGAKGGGSAQMVQGSLKTEDIEAVVDAIK
jgi:alanyl-tRNA synthetase